MKKLIDFLSEKERATLLEWALSQKENLDKNNSGEGRYFKALDALKCPPLIKTVRARLEKEFGVSQSDAAEFLPAYLSINEEGAFIHLHKNLSPDGKNHNRYNIILSLPESGGEVLYEESEGPELVPEGALYVNEASKYEHGTTPVVGSKPRVILSFGYLD